MNVLSLFDGISCGQIALERAGIKVDKYFASEIDKNAIKVTQKNYPETIQLGDVSKIDLESLPKIDLVLAGSPCQGFSFAGKQLNFDDPRSKLFFVFVDVLKFLKKKNPSIKFLLENVKMKKEYEQKISEILGVKPLLINSSLFSAQNRSRLYWTNFCKELGKIEDKGIVFEDILDNQGVYELIEDKKVVHRTYTKNYLQYDMNGRGHKSQSQRACYLNKKHLCLDTTCSGKVYDGKNVRKTTRLEAERLQTLPDGYTNSIGENEGKKAIGNGWTIDVIVHILKHYNLQEG